MSLVGPRPERPQFVEKFKEENILGTEKISKLMLKFSIPSIISLVVNSLYNIVDQIFIGQGVGYLGNGATNIEEIIDIPTGENTLNVYAIDINGQETTFSMLLC